MGKAYISEEILGVLNAIWTHTWKPNYHCHLVFTNKRLIVARIGLLRELMPYLLVAVGAGAGTAAAGAVGAGAGSGAGVATSAIFSGKDKKSEKLKQISPEQVLKSNKKNLDAPYSNITRIQVGKKLGTSRLYVFTSNAVHKFKFEGIKIEEVERSIRSLVADKVVIEKLDKLN